MFAIETGDRGRQARRIAPCLLLLALLAGRSEAQLLDAWSLDSGVDATPPMAQARLDGMGGMRESVPDENNEINLLDFGRNVTGELDDKPTSHVDAYSGPRRWYDQSTPADPDEDFRTFPFFFKYNALPSPNDALGGEIFVESSTGERLITPDFRHRFRLPIENPAAGSNDGTLLIADLSRQVLAAHYAHRFRDWLSAGVRASYGHEEEDRDRTNLYLINHEVDNWALDMSLAGTVVKEAGPLRNLVLGTNVQLIQTAIDGLSKDDLHVDEFTWERPTWGLDIHALGDVYDWIHGGLNIRYKSFDGQEEMDQNWSAQFPLNPTQVTITQHLSSMEEGSRQSQLETRVEARPPDLPATFGLGFEMGQSEYWLNPFQNINSFQSAKNERLTAWRLTGGGSYHLDQGMGLLAAEMSYGLEDLDDRVTVPTVRTGSSLFELGLGGEYTVTETLVGRAGYRLFLEDEDRDHEGESQELTTQRFALGGGFRIPNGRVFIDAAFQYDFVDRGEEPGQEFDDEDRSNFTLQVRSLF